MIEKLKRFLFLLLIGAPLVSVAQVYPLHITDEGHILIQVSLADSISGNFILDTGAGANVLSASLFQKIEAEATKTGYFTGFRHDGDRLDGAVYEIPYLAIGDSKQLRPIVGVYPPLDDYGIDGLLSLKFFENRAFTLDFEQRTLTILTAEEVEALDHHEALPLFLYRYTNIVLDVFLPIKLNDSIELLAEFDTGSGYDTYLIHPGYIEDLALDKKKGVAQSYTTQLSGESRTDSLFTLHSISIGNSEQQLRQKEVAVLFREGLIHNALIGSGMFRDRKVTIDIPRRKFILH